ncbi:HD domain-containing protein [Halopseudomonas sabulinigri]|uniref:HD domain-containing protein n=1 Tax=Halopseudomonas sabulinigri TaxID=472181 RepID=A0A1H1PXP3_9GAMM|nr:HD domain-containing phosphohydrolase [Halopseudomonas sabulinigri]SDS15975.1 HD domain-containing protein [Halopseudomonas sabulinigri]
MGKTKSSVSLQWLIAWSMVICLLAMASLTVWQGYRGSRTLLIAAANDAAQQLGVLLNERSERLLGPAESALRILNYDPLAQSNTLEQRLQRLPVLIETLRSNRTLSAVYAGYPNGDFFLLRRVESGLQAGGRQLPRGTAYLVQSIEHLAGANVQGRWLAYDNQGEALREVAVSDYRFDPRTRPWYQLAESASDIVLTEPYLFFTNRNIGVTMARRNPAGVVFGLDASLQDLAGEVNDLRLTPGTEIALVGERGKVIAYTDLQRIVTDGAEGLQLATLPELGVPVLEAAHNMAAEARTPQLVELGGQEWYVLNLPLRKVGNNPGSILIAMPAKELLAGVRDTLRDQARLVFALAALLLLIGWALGQRLGQPLKSLGDQVEQLAGFDFSAPIGVRSRIREVNDLSKMTARMAKAIARFQTITLTLSRETNLERMLDLVLEQLIAIAGGQGGAVYLYDEDDGVLRCAGDTRPVHYPGSVPLDDARLKDPARSLASQLDDEHRYLTLALRDRQGDLQGVLAVEVSPLLTNEAVRSLRQFLGSLAGTLAVAIETRQLFDDQQLLLESIIRLLASAIDAKSPYTGGHCDRVPQLAEMLLEQAQQAEEGPFASFALTQEQRYAFRTAAWLHDCGKITSPEYVVDKATKLETLYNRIHEIRTRFEVLWREADIRYWQGRAAGEDESVLQQTRDAEQARLREEFAVVAKANTGGEFMAQEDRERLQVIGKQTWLRYFDNRLGLSGDEQQQLIGVSAAALPVEEQLLMDRPEHLVPWGERKPPVAANDPANRWGFDMELPAHSSNLGELYNLSIARGTLTAEERFKINDHIVQTLIMLSTLPFPKALARVPELAATHHERLDGTGYPRRLSAEQLSVEDRVLAIADIFEALTAADRPYKEAKKLSESVRIMLFMARDQHLDARLLALFLSTGVHLQYGRRFLAPEQLDEVDVPACIDQLRGWGLLDD